MCIRDRRNHAVAVDIEDQLFFEFGGNFDTGRSLVRLVDFDIEIIAGGDAGYVLSLSLIHI